MLCELAWGFPKFGVPYWGPYYTGILLFGGLYIGGPVLSRAPTLSGGSGGSVPIPRDSFDVCLRVQGWGFWTFRGGPSEKPFGLCFGGSGLIFPLFPYFLIARKSP